MKRPQSTRPAHQEIGECQQTSAPQVLAGSDPPLGVEYKEQPRSTSMPLPPNMLYVSYPYFLSPPPPEAPRPPQALPRSPTKASDKQSRTESIALIYHCASCGKPRSAGYHNRYPLELGKEPPPSFCRKCAKKFTSSEGSEESGQDNHSGHRRSTARGSHQSNSPSKGENQSEDKTEVQIDHRMRLVRPSKGPKASRPKAETTTRVRVVHEPREHQRSRRPSDDERTICVRRIQDVAKGRRRRPSHGSRSSSFSQSIGRADRSDSHRYEEKHIHVDSPPQLPSPRVIRTVEYTCEYDNDDELGRPTSRPEVLHRSESTITYPATPIDNYQDEYSDVNATEHAYYGHYLIRERSYDFDPHTDEAVHPPTSSVRIIRVLDDTARSSHRPVPRRRSSIESRGSFSSLREIPLLERQPRRPVSSELLPESEAHEPRPRRRRLRPDDFPSHMDSDEEYIPGTPEIEIGYD